MAHYRSKTGRQEARQYRFGADGGTTVVACPPCEKPGLIRTLSVVVLGVMIGEYVSRRVRKG